MDSFEVNKYAGAVLAALLTLFGTKTILDLALRKHAPEKPGYVLPVSAAGGAATAVAAPKLNLAADLPKADLANGANVFKICAACHTADKGGPNKVGPNLYGIVGRKVGMEPSFDYSPAMKSYGGDWTFERIAAYLQDPKVAVPGNKMAFPGVKDPADLVDVLGFLRSKADSPAPLPK
jgi:cytochrome c